MGASELWVGSNDVDYSGYPDCTAEFLESFRAMIATAMPDGPQIIAPLMGMTKPAIADVAKSLGLVHGDTWSCYQPSITSHGIVPCGKCDACVLHDYAWQVASSIES
jgi:7-cyano-7-deazaguanine synthase